MLLALAAALAIVAQDRTPLRAAPRPQAAELATLSQGEVLEVRDERAGYLKVYDYHREHGRFRRRFEELRLADLLPVQQASNPELLADFGRWQDVAWRRDTLALY